MRDNRINYVMVGTFVLAMGAALVVALALLTGRTGATDTFYTYYANVSGLKYGTKVLFEGYPIGQIEKITPVREEGKPRFRVTMSVEDGWQIPEDSKALVATSGLLAAVAIEIRSGKSDKVVPPGGVVEGGAAGNIFAVMTDVANEVSDLSQNSLKPLLATINRYVGNLGGVLEHQAPQLLDNLILVSRDLAEKTPRITSNVQDFSSDLTKTGDQINKILSDGNTEKLGQTLDNMNRFSGNLASLTQDLHSSRKQVDQLLANLNKTVESNQGKVGQSLDDLRYTLQTVSRSIDSVTRNLEGTTRNLNEFSREVRQNPGVLIGGTEKGETGPARR